MSLTKYRYNKVLVNLCVTKLADLPIAKARPGTGEISGERGNSPQAEKIGLKKSAPKIHEKTKKYRFLDPTF
jgi:hypothetical protein